MKKIIPVLALFIFSVYAHAQSGVQFTTPIVVANGATYGYLRPKIALDGNNDPVILWGKTSTNSIYVSTYNGAGFNAPVKINPAGTVPYISSYYNADIKSNGDTMVAVFSTDVPAYHVYLVKSLDGGDTWSDTIRIDNIPIDQMPYYPSVDINEFGNIAVTFMRYDAGMSNPRYVVTTSIDGGNTFSPDTNASAIAPGEVCVCCPAQIIYENNKIVTVFRNNDANLREFYAAVSNDNGTSFNGINIDNQGWVYPACPSVAPSAFINNDSLITVFMSGASGANRIYLSTSDIGTMQNGIIQMIDSVVPAGTLQSHPKIAGKDSIMAMVWYNTMPGELDIYFRFSNSGASGLIGDGVNISNPTTGIQQNPDIIYANGVFHIVYQNNGTQELYYLKAVLDAYVGMEDNKEKTFTYFIQNDQLTILLNENVFQKSIEIFDAKGGVVLKSSTDNSQSISLDIQHLSHGIYWLRIEGYGKPVKFWR